MAEATNSVQERESEDSIERESDLVNTLLNIEDTALELDTLLSAAEIIAWRVTDMRYEIAKREFDTIARLITMMLNKKIAISQLVEAGLSPQTAKH